MVSCRFEGGQPGDGPELGDDAFGLLQQPHEVVEVVLGHQHHLVDHGEHGLDGLGDRDAGGGVGGRGVEGSLLVEGVLHAAGAFRAHADDADVRKTRINPRDIVAWRMKTERGRPDRWRWTTAT